MDNILQYYSFLFFIFGSILVCILMLIFGFFLGGKSNNRYKNTPFESGITSFGNAHIQIPIKFSLVAILFVIFDVEALYLYIWSVSVIENGWIGFIESFFLINLIFITLLYLWKKKIFK